MNNASLDILQACSAIASSLAGVAMMAPLYAAIWTLAWIASEQLGPPTGFSSRR